MLYVTTRCTEVTNTAQTTLIRKTDADGGLYVPMRLPNYSPQDLQAMAELPFWGCVARVLGQFFPVRLSESDFQDLAVPKFEILRHKVHIAQLWNKKQGSYEGTKKQICQAIGSKVTDEASWPAVAVDIAVLFGLYGCLCRDGVVSPGVQVSVAVEGDSFSFAAASMYAKDMGLPVSVTVCVSGDNGIVWDLLHKGESRLSSAGKDLVYENLERLIVHRLGRTAGETFRSACERRKVFSLNAEQRRILRKDFFISVVGSSRGQMLIPRTYRSAGYLLSPPTACVYGGVMDYRAMEGEGAPVLLLAEESPVKWGEQVLQALNLPRENIAEQIAALEKAELTGKGD